MQAYTMDHTPVTTMQLEQIFNEQKRNLQNLKNTSASERIAKLKKLKATIKDMELEIKNAIHQDLRKPHPESLLTEIIVTYSELNFTIKNLKKWMQPQRVSTYISNLGTSEIRYEPKGVNLIIAPWNYPFQLLIAPLVSAIAAGNACMLKPSELSPATSAVLVKLIKRLFPENEVAIFEGDAEVSKALLKLPFDHIFFTGSPAIGKVVMEAASKHLTAVTLELGGKSPVIIDPSANIKIAAQKVMWGKTLNAGQICLAPDYVLIPENKKDEFISHCKDYLKTCYQWSENGRVDKTDYCKIINERHFGRIKNLIIQAADKGATVEVGGTYDADDHTIHPTILSNIPDDCEVMHEEIFGPVLPIKTYKTLDEAIAYVNSKPKPLALYIFSSNTKPVKHIIQNTSAGGTCVNDLIVHIGNPHLPFGGVNNSGLGSYHGHYGFKCFSHERSVYYQFTWLDLGSMITPPYSKRNGIMNVLKKMFE